MVNKKVLADIWGVGLKISNTTLKETTQRGIRSFTLPIIR